MRRKFIPWAEPRFWGSEERLVADALKSTWISGGPYVDKLESELRNYCGSPYVAVTSNGTTAIHAAYLALGVRAGDEVIVPSFGFMAAANVALRIGAVPVFADVDPETWCVTAATLRRCITEKTKGIVPVHTYGNVCDMDGILELAEGSGIWVLEDAAEAFGSLYRGKQAGTSAQIGTYSFHATKTITTGEGGAVCTRDAALHEKLLLYRSHGVGNRRYWHEVAGHNFRMPNMQAALGCAQIERIDDIATERHRVYRSYVTALAEVKGAKLQRMTDGVQPLVWTVAVRLDPAIYGQGRDAVMTSMNERGIETRPGFHAAGEMTHLYAAPEAIEAMELARQVICLPSSPTVSDEEICQIVCLLSDLAQNR